MSMDAGILVFFALIIGIALGYSVAGVQHGRYMTRGWHHIAMVTRSRDVNIGDVVDAFGIAPKDAQRNGRL